MLSLVLTAEPLRFLVKACGSLVGDVLSVRRPSPTSDVDLLVAPGRMQAAKAALAATLAAGGLAFEWSRHGGDRFAEAMVGGGLRLPVQLIGAGDSAEGFYGPPDLVSSLLTLGTGGRPELLPFAFPADSVPRLLALALRLAAGKRLLLTLRDWRPGRGRAAKYARRGCRSADAADVQEFAELDAAAAPPPPPSPQRAVLCPGAMRAGPLPELFVDAHAASVFAERDAFGQRMADPPNATAHLSAGGLAALAAAAARGLFPPLQRERRPAGEEGDEEGDEGWSSDADAD